MSSEQQPADAPSGQDESGDPISIPPPEDSAAPSAPTAEGEPAAQPEAADAGGPAAEPSADSKSNEADSGAPPSEVKGAVEGAEDKPPPPRGLFDNVDDGPVDGAGDAKGGAIGFPTPEVIVSGPEKRGDGMRAFMSYTLTTRLFTPGQDSDDCVVERRYSDFAWLRQRLEAECAGYLVPPLPEKLAIGRFDSRFLEQRKRGLQNFLRKLTQHRVLRKRPEVDLFLRSTRFEAAKKTLISKSPTSSRSAFTLFSNIGSAFTALTVTPIKVEESKDDVECARIAQMAVELRRVLLRMHTSLGILLRREREAATAMMVTGKAVTHAGKVEQELGDDTLGAFLLDVGKTCDKSYMDGFNTNDELAVRLYEPAKMLLRTVEGLQRLMVVRKKARDKYVTAASVAAKRKTTLDAVRAKPDASEASKQSAQTANDNAEREAKDAKDALDRVTKAALSEAALFQADKVRDLRAMYKAFVAARASLVKRQYDAWKELAFEFEVDLGDEFAVRGAPEPAAGAAAGPVSEQSV